MELKFAKPNKSLLTLHELQKNKKKLNSFKNEDNINYFLENNRSNHNIKNKVDLILSNFEENTLFLYSDKSKYKLFDFLEKSEIEYNLKESLIYKMYLYFYGFTEDERLKKLLLKYSENKNKKINFKYFIESHSKELFQSEYNFPKTLNAKYKALNEIIFLIENNYKILEDLEYWEQNFLEYLNSSENFDRKIITKINNKILEKANSKIAIFFTKNKKITIKSVDIDYSYFEDKYSKIININLEKKDTLSLILDLKNKNNKKIYYLEKNYKKIILDEDDLIEVFKDNYSLSKIYLFKHKIKKYIGRKAEI